MKKWWLAAPVAALIVACGSGGGADPAPPDSEYVSPAPVAEPSSAVPLKGGIVKEGTLLVGRDVKPGSYETTVPLNSTGCYWARLRSPDDDMAIIANGVGNPGDQVTVKIQKTDKAFVTRGCGTWGALNG